VYEFGRNLKLIDRVFRQVSLVVIPIWEINLSMNDEQRKKYTDEVNEIIKSRFEFINRHYPSIRKAYQNHYDWPELDPLRHEICICITFGLCQAAITLTNHLLESLLKLALIIKCGDKVKQSEDDIRGRVISALIEKYKDCIEKYNDKSLSTTINLLI